MDIAPTPTPPPAAPSSAWFNARFPRLAGKLDRLGLPPGYLLCAPLALFAIWGHRYPPGIDMPQHANTMRLWLELHGGPAEYGTLYQTNLFTPYVLTYLLAYPFAKLFGGLIAIKVILTVTALAMPLTMSQWLRTLGGDRHMALLAFPILFGFAYVWGFLSHLFAMTLLFAYLASFERQGARPSLAQGVTAGCWALLLFFCHGFTFGVAGASAGLRLVVRRRPLSMWRAGLHLVPAAITMLVWLASREKQLATVGHGGHFVNLTLDRLSELFSGLFVPVTSYGWAGVAAGVVGVAAVVVRPKLNRSLGVWVPLGLVTACFFILPNWVAETAVVGPRFCVYVQAFACGAFVAAVGRERRFEIASLVATVASLLLLNTRLYRFNGELDGLRTLAKQVGPYADVQTFMPKAGGASGVFGFRGLSETPAWISADTGGLIADDYGRFYQMPVQHKHTRFPQRYRYVFTLSPDGEVKKKFPDAQLLARSGAWSLFEQSPLKLGDLEVVRFAQGWGDLKVDASVINAPLTVNGVVFDHGLGTHASSFIRIHVPPAQSTLEGGCAVDDSSSNDAQMAFQIRSSTGRVLFRTAPMKKGNGVRRFSVSLGEDREVLLETLTVTRTNEGLHADWVDLK